MFSYRPSDEKLLEDLHGVLHECGTPLLESVGFEAAPFCKDAFKGKTNLGGYMYQYCRLQEPHLEFIRVSIAKGEPQMKLYFNAFQLRPFPSSMIDLSDRNGLQFSLAPNNSTEVRISPEMKGFIKPKSPFRLRLGLTEDGYRSGLADLCERLRKELSDIQRHVRNWYEKKQPMVTDWQGAKID